MPPGDDSHSDCVVAQATGCMLFAHVLMMHAASRQAKQKKENREFWKAGFEEEYVKFVGRNHYSVLFSDFCQNLPIRERKKKQDAAVQLHHLDANQLISTRSAPLRQGSTNDELHILSIWFTFFFVSTVSTPVPPHSRKPSKTSLHTNASHVPGVYVTSPSRDNGSRTATGFFKLQHIHAHAKTQLMITNPHSCCLYAKTTTWNEPMATACVLWCLPLSSLPCMHSRHTLPTIPKPWPGISEPWPVIPPRCDP